MRRLPIRARSSPTCRARSSAARPPCRSSTWSIAPWATKKCGSTKHRERSRDMRAALSMVGGVMLTLIALPVSAPAQTVAAAEARLKELNITLPPDSAPAANFANAVQTGKLLFLSGNTPGGQWPLKGKVGKDLTVEQGYQSARQAGLIMLGKIRAALGSLDRVKRIVKVLGMVNSADGFSDQPRVVNGFSDLMVEVFGESIGKHARSAVGMAGLPGNAAVEVEMIVEVE